MNLTPGLALTSLGHRNMETPAAPRPPGTGIPPRAVRPGRPAAAPPPLPAPAALQSNPPRNPRQPPKPTAALTRSDHDLLTHSREPEPTGSLACLTESRLTASPSHRGSKRAAPAFACSPGLVTRFRVLRTGVHQWPLPSVTCPDTTGVVADERRQTGVNETQTETADWTAFYGAALVRSDAP